MDHSSLGMVAERIFVGLADSRLRAEVGVRVPVVHIKDVRDGMLPPCECLDTRLVSDRADVRRYELQDRDVVITCRGTHLRVGIASPSTSGAIASANLIAIRTSEGLLPEVLLAFLRTGEGQHALRAAGQGTTGLSLRPSDVAQLRIPVPSPKVQRRLAALIQASELYYRTSIDVAEHRRSLAQATIERVLLHSPGGA